jgi:hypothetical protein
MNRPTTETRTTRTGELAGAAFYYARGLRFARLEMRSPAGVGGAFNVNFVFSGGPEVTALADELYDDNPEVTLDEVKAFVAVLCRRLKSGRLVDGEGAPGGLTTEGGGA